jgi:hypothetical protein
MRMVTGGTSARGRAWGAALVCTFIGTGIAADPMAASEVESPATPFRIIATDTGYMAPDRLAAGLRHIVFENRGSEIHEAMFVKLAQGMSADDYVAAIKAGSLFPEGALDYSGPGLTSPGQSTEIWLHVDPGYYVLVCWYNDHTATVPVHLFTVVPGNVPDDTPPPHDAVLRLVDFRFDLDGELDAGTHVIRIETPGPSMHEMDIYRMLDGRTLSDVADWYEHGKRTEAAAPVIALGGVLDSHDIHHVMWLRKTFEPGRYVLRCQMPMTTGPEVSSVELSHAQVGMVRELVIE